MRKFMLGVALLAIAACSGSDLTSPDNIAGVYNLKTVDGSPLPFLDQGGTDNFVIITDAITMKIDKSWTESVTYQQTINGAIVPGTLTDGGTWTAAGDAMTFLSDGIATPTYTGTYTRNTLTLNGLGYVQVFVR